MSAYITRTELYQLGIPSGSLDVSVSTVDAHISGASDLIDAHLRSQHDLPLVEVPFTVKMWTAHIASFTLASAEGFSTEAIEQLYSQRYYDLVGQGETRGILSRVSKGEIIFASTADSTSTNEGRARIYSGRVTTSDNASLMGWRTHSSS